jgi:hypothetical protein
MTRSMSGRDSGRGTSPPTHGTADGPSGCVPVIALRHRRPPWAIWMLDRAPSAWIAPASRASPGTMASSWTPSAQPEILPVGCTYENSTVISPTPPRARSVWYRINRSVTAPVHVA